MKALEKTELTAPRIWPTVSLCQRDIRKEALKLLVVTGWQWGPTEAGKLGKAHLRRNGDHIHASIHPFNSNTH